MRVQDSTAVHTWSVSTCAKRCIPIMQRIDAYVGAYMIQHLRGPRQWLTDTEFGPPDPHIKRPHRPATKAVAKPRQSRPCFRAVTSILPVAGYHLDLSCAHVP